MVNAIVDPLTNILKRGVGPDDRVREYDAMYVELERRVPGLPRANANDIRADPSLAVALFREAAESMRDGHLAELNAALERVVRRILDEPGLYRSGPSLAFFQFAQDCPGVAGLFHMFNLVVIDLDQTKTISTGSSSVVRRAVNLANMTHVTAKIVTVVEGRMTREQQQAKIMSCVMIHMDAQALAPELVANVFETHICNGVELDGALVVIVMEYAHHTLEHLVNMHKNEETRTYDLDIAYAKQVMLFLAKVLRALSQHDPTIVHRGIKPEHILLLSSLDTEPADIVFKLTDFGQSRLAGGTMGTIVPISPTVAPEVINSANVYYTLRSEMWSTGATLLYVLTGFYPVDPDVFLLMSRAYRMLGGDQDWFMRRLTAMVPQRLNDPDFNDFIALLEPCLRITCPEDHVDPCAADARCRQPGFNERWCRECFINAAYELLEPDEPNTPPPSREARRLTLELAAARAQRAASEAELAQLRTLHDTLKRTFVGLVVHLNRWKRCLETIRPAVQTAVQANGVADDAADAISLALVAADETALLEVPPHQGDVSDALTFAFGRGLPTRLNGEEAQLQAEAMRVLDNILLTLPL